MIKDSDLHESQASENQSALIFDLVGKILASAALRANHQSGEDGSFKGRGESDRGSLRVILQEPEKGRK